MKPEAFCKCGAVLTEKDDPTGMYWFDLETDPPIYQTTWHCDSCGQWYLRHLKPELTIDGDLSESIFREDTP